MKFFLCRRCFTVKNPGTRYTKSLRKRIRQKIRKISASHLLQRRLINWVFWRSYSTSHCQKRAKNLSLQLILFPNLSLLMLPFTHFLSSHSFDLLLSFFSFLCSYLLCDIFLPHSFLFLLILFRFLFLAPSFRRLFADFRTFRFGFISFFISTFIVLIVCLSLFPFFILFRGCSPRPHYGK